MEYEFIHDAVRRRASSFFKAGVRDSHLPVGPLFATGRPGQPPIARLSVHPTKLRRSRQAHQHDGGLNQLRRIESHAIFENQLNLLHVFNLLRRVATQHHQIGGLARRNRSDARVSADVLEQVLRGRKGL